MMNCKRATQLMSQKMDRPLTFKERLSLRFHLMICSGCRNFNDQMLDLRQIMKGYAKGKDKTEHKEKDSE